MKKEYINCKNGLTPQCPNYDNPIMRKFLAKPGTSAGVDYFNAGDIDAANSLCRDCDAFIPIQE